MEGSKRRERLLKMAAGAGFLALAVVLVLIVVNATSGSGGDTELEDVAAVNSLLRGIPQEGLLLGNPKASVELIEYGDLQCPVCKGYSEEILPPIIEKWVKKGEVKLDFRNLAIIGEESIAAGGAALAAGEQGRGWNYVELFYRNQGEENSGYVDDAFLEAVAKGAGVKNLKRWNEERLQLLPEVEATTAEAARFGFTGTPSFMINSPKEGGFKPLGTPDSAEALEEAIEEAI